MNWKFVRSTLTQWDLDWKKKQKKPLMVFNMHYIAHWRSSENMRAKTFGYKIHLCVNVYMEKSRRFHPMHEI